MLIKSITLKNIRSYLNETIEFPEGSVLFSGDIGSGKSTILLSIEFALFGIMRPELTGTTLLRNGKKEGFVELVFEIEDKEVIIRRVLKRGKTQVGQDSGYIIVAGNRTTGTAVELKQKILDLLGYPKDLLTKSKSLIFKYTVYTPQEKIKEILFGNQEARLEILRKIFGIEKYKRIRENSQILMKELREKKIIFESQILDLDEKKGQRKELLDILNRVKKSLDENQKKLEKDKDIFDKLKKEINENEKSFAELRLMKKDLAVLGAELVGKVEASTRNKIEIEDIEKNIENINKNINESEKEKSKIEELEKLLKEKKQQIIELEKESKKKEKILSDIDKIKGIVEQLKSENIKLETKIDSSKNTVKRVSEIDKCPSCLQIVDKSHKEGIKERENKTIRELDAKRKLVVERIKENEVLLKDLKIDKEKIESSLSNIGLIKVDIRNISEKIDEKKEKTHSFEKIIKTMKQRLTERLNLKEELKKDVGIINKKKIELIYKIKESSASEEKLESMKEKFEEILNKKQETELQVASLKKEKENLDTSIVKLQKDIDEKEKLSARLSKTQQFENWIKKYFIKLMEIIEKNIMAQVYHNFNDIFMQWFNMLIEEEIITAKLNDEFAPVVEQNNHKVEIENLSGGEKTALSLAYRLALNKVINDFIDEIKTKDIIILDEPTDGFSSEQLDRVRDVLEQLNVKQSIIVSHEQKMESFVGQVIRIEKEGHVSKVLV